MMGILNAVRAFLERLRSHRADTEEMDEPAQPDEVGGTTMNAGGVPAYKGRHITIENPNDPDLCLEGIEEFLLVMRDKDSADADGPVYAALILDVDTAESLLAGSVLATRKALLQLGYSEAEARVTCANGVQWGLACLEHPFTYPVKQRNGRFYSEDVIRLADEMDIEMP